jgi:glycine cleavage system H lipoate-binding protein
MSILFVLLMFLIILTVGYIRQPGEEAEKPVMLAKPAPPRMLRDFGIEVPQGYSFHPSHTWVLKEGADVARVGLDSFAGNLLGAIERIEVPEVDRWVRQGQKLFTVHVDGTTVNLLSPVEGVLTAINKDAVHDPSLITRDPYQNGWIVTLKAPDLATNQRNLLQGAMVAPWLRYGLSRVQSALSQLSPALAQDGGVPVRGVLTKIPAEVRQQLLNELFLM